MIQPMAKPNATLALRAYVFVLCTIAGLILAGAMVAILLMLASWLEKHQAVGTADWLNYGLAAAVVVHAADDPVDVPLSEDSNPAGGNA